jgi:hypothetical protein
MFMLVISALTITTVEVSAESSSVDYNSSRQSYVKGGFFDKSDKVLSDDLYETINNGEDEEVIVEFILSQYDPTKLVKILSQFDNYFDQNGLIKSNLTDIEVREAKVISNNEKMKLQSKINEKFLSKLKVEYQEIYVGSYSPYVVLRISDTHLQELSENKRVFYMNKINDFYIPVPETDIMLFCEDVDPECGGGSGGSTTPTPNEQNLDDIDVDKFYSAYDGTDIKIGVLDAGIVDENHSDFDNTPVVRDVWGYTETVHNHSTMVALVAAGVDGVAPDATIYSVEANSYNGVSSEFDWLVSQNVSLINISLALWDYCDGSYNSATDYIDYMAFEYDLVVTKSAGNNTCSSGTNANQHIITSPGLGYNIITVGATDATNTAVAGYSAFNEEESNAPDKPNLLAPGSWEFDTWGVQIGTSFAAPAVAGAIARIWDKNASLESEPQKTIAAVMAGVDRSKVTESAGMTNSGLRQVGGAGFLNVYNSAYLDTYTWSNYQDDGVYTKRVYLNNYESIQVSIVWFEASFYSMYTVHSYNISNYDIEVYDMSGNLIQDTGSTTTNTEFMRFTNYSGSANYFDIKIVAVDVCSAYSSTKKEVVGIAIFD